MRRSWKESQVCSSTIFNNSTCSSINTPYIVWYYLPAQDAERHLLVPFFLPICVTSLRNRYWWPGGNVETSWDTRMIKLVNYSDVIMSTMASQITSLMIVYSTVYSGEDQRKHQSSASLTFVMGIHRWPLTLPHKGPVTRKMFPFDDVIMWFQTKNHINI